MLQHSGQDLTYGMQDISLHRPALNANINELHNNMHACATQDTMARR